MKKSHSKTLHCALLLAASLLMTPSLYAEPPVQVYIMAGQSNMQGKGSIEGDHGGSLRGIVKNHPKQYGFFADEKGEWVERKDVWIHYDLYPFRELRYGLLKPGYGASGGQIGPEFGFGHAMGEESEGKVLLIKAAWGGKSIGHNFLPPSVGKYPVPSEPEQDPGYFFHRTVQLVAEVTENMKDFFPDYKGQGVELAGICWHQGWNDQYGGLEESYEANLAAFIKDIRSVEHGLGVPDLPFVIASSGMIMPESPVVQGQIAIGDAKKYAEFVGNVSVIDTHQPYGPDKMTFKFDNDGVTEKVGYHWNNNARSYSNIGIAMAAEMRKLKRPKSPARFRAYGSEQGVQLLWQLGTEKPEGIEILRNGKSVGAKLSPTQTAFTDTAALPGANSYELILDMPSGKVKFNASCDTSATNLDGYRSLDGVMLSWITRGKYDAFRILRDGKVIADAVPADARSFEDKAAPAKGMVTYSIQPTTGMVTPAKLTVNLGPADTGGALIYEPFDYPTSAEEPKSLLGKAGVSGTKSEYVSLDEKPKDLPKVIAGGLSFGALPVAGNCAQMHLRGGGCAIDLDDGLKKAGLLEDGATVWISFLYHIHQTRGQGVRVSLQSADGKEAIGFDHKGVTNTFIIDDGAEKRRLLVKGVRAATTYYFVGKITWGEDGEPDQLLPYHVQKDLKLPEKPGRVFTEPFDIDQSKLSRLVLEGGATSDVDEIRVGSAFESVVGGGTK
jgi:alpha-galactosidase